MPTAFKPQKRSQGRPPALILCGLLIIALRLAMPSAPAPMPDLPASDEPAGTLPLPLEEVLPLSTCVILGAIATATAPAATMMVINQYKAKGPLTDILLPIVALDDAVGLVLFAVSFGVAKAMIHGEINPLSVILEPILEVVLSLALGALMGFLFSFFEQFFHSRSKRMAMSVAFVLMTVALSMIQFTVGGVHVAFSSLLVCMMMGTIFCNVCDFSEELMERVERWSAPLLVLFFVISGAELELSVFTDVAVVAIGLIYILFRSAGKISGAYISAKASGCDEKEFALDRLQAAIDAREQGSCYEACAELRENARHIYHRDAFTPGNVL